MVAKNLRELKVNAVVNAVLHGASEEDVRRLAPEQGIDHASIEAGLKKARKVLKTDGLA